MSDRCSECRQPLKTEEERKRGYCKNCVLKVVARVRRETPPSEDAKEYETNPVYHQGKKIVVEGATVINVGEMRRVSGVKDKYPPKSRYNIQVSIDGETRNAFVYAVIHEYDGRIAKIIPGRTMNEDGVTPLLRKGDVITYTSQSKTPNVDSITENQMLEILGKEKDVPKEWINCVAEPVGDIISFLGKQVGVSLKAKWTGSHYTDDEGNNMPIGISNGIENKCLIRLGIIIDSFDNEKVASYRDQVGSGGFGRYITGNSPQSSDKAKVDEYWRTLCSRMFALHRAFPKDAPPTPPKEKEETGLKWVTKKFSIAEDGEVAYV